jgi:hypothetical protein
MTAGQQICLPSQTKTEKLSPSCVLRPKTVIRQIVFEKAIHRETRKWNDHRSACANCVDTSVDTRAPVPARKQNRSAINQRTVKKSNSYHKRHSAFPSWPPRGLFDLQQTRLLAHPVTHAKALH